MTDHADDGASAHRQARQSIGPSESWEQPRAIGAAGLGADIRFDMLDGVMASSRQGRRGPPTLTLEITWVDGSTADALRRIQARVLRDLLAALPSGPKRAANEDEQEAPPE